MTKSKAVFLLILGALFTTFFVFDLSQYFSIDFFKAQQASIEQYFEANPWKTVIVFFLVYVAVTGLSLPGAAVMTLVAGAIFGLLWGTVIVSFASTLGATIAFLFSRFLFKETVQTKFAHHLTAINKGIEQDGPFYLFTLRLVPAFPFFVINLVMGLTPIKTLTFFWVSQVGMLAGTIVYVNAGTQIAQIDSLAGILSPGLIISFILLGIFPWIARAVTDRIKSYQVLKSYEKPKKFDRNLVVIGGGSAGLVTSYIAAVVNAKVTLIEKHKMGGDCLNTGCVPSKALIRSAKFVSQAKKANNLGIKDVSLNFDFADVMERVQRVIKTIEPHDSVERYSKLGVECINGEAWIKSPYEVEVNGQRITTRNIVVATGARPYIPDIPGLNESGFYTSDTIWELRKQPKRLLVLGGGPIGCELAQAFNRLGSQVTLVQSGERILLREDVEISELVQERFLNEGMSLKLNHRAQEVIIENGEKYLLCETSENQARIAFDEILIAVGRQANVKGFGLEELGVKVSERRTVAVNEFLQTNFPNIYACGDVAGPFQFTHTAAHQAWYASVNALFSPFKRFKVDYSVIPWATFTDPEVARVGLNELEAKEKGIDYEVTVYGIDDLDRAIADEAAHGLVKVLTVPGKDKILGVTIVGEHAGDLIAEYVAAMRHGFGMNKILSTIHIYPTLAEANKFAAGEWKRNHKPEKLLAWVAKFHQWRLGA